MPAACPHCRAPVEANAAFCGACGGKLVGASRAASGGTPPDSPSLFELPSSRSGRLVRVAAVLTLDAVLLGAGVAMILSYLNARAAAAQPPQAAQVVAIDAGPVASVEVESPEPKVVKPDGVSRPVRPGKPSTGGGGSSGGTGASSGGTGTGSGGTGGTGGTRPDTPPAGTPSDIGGLGGFVRKPDAGVPSGPDAGGSFPAGGLPTPDAAPVTPPPLPGEPDAAPQTGPGPTVPPADVPDAAPIDPNVPTDDEQILADGVRDTMDAKMGLVRKCWEHAAKGSADENAPQGTVEIEFTVLQSGVPSTVRLRQNTTGSDELGTCIVALVESFRFPSHTGEPVTFVWPFLFRAAR